MWADSNSLFNGFRFLSRNIMGWVKNIHIGSYLGSWGISPQECGLAPCLFQRDGLCSEKDHKQSEERAGGDFGIDWNNSLRLWRHYDYFFLFFFLFLFFFTETENRNRRNVWPSTHFRNIREDVPALLWATAAKMHIGQRNINSFYNFRER